MCFYLYIFHSGSPAISHLFLVGIGCLSDPTGWHTHTIYNSYIFIACDHVLEKHTFSFSMSIRFTNYSRKSKSQKRAFFTVSLFRIICIVLKHLSSATQFVDCRFWRDSVRIVWYAHRLRLYKWHSNTLLYNVFMNENWLCSDFLCFSTTLDYTIATVVKINGLLLLYNYFFCHLSSSFSLSLTELRYFSLFPPSLCASRSPSILFNVRIVFFSSLSLLSSSFLFSRSLFLSLSI